MVFVRPCRSATIRTRLDPETIRARLAGLADGTEDSGVIVARGHFLGGGRVDAREFHFDFRLNSAKNAQNYAVHGRVQDTRDWRVLRLKLTAHDRWLAPIELAFLAGFIALHVVFDAMPAGGAVAFLAALMAMYAFINLLWIPDKVTSRVADIVASTVNGSVQVKGGWEVARP